MTNAYIGANGEARAVVSVLVFGCTRRGIRDTPCVAPAALVSPTAPRYEEDGCTCYGDQGG
jgi:hypothetical protein